MREILDIAKAMADGSRLRVLMALDGRRVVRLSDRGAAATGSFDGLQAHVHPAAGPAGREPQGRPLDVLPAAGSRGPQGGQGRCGLGASGIWGNRRKSCGIGKELKRILSMDPEEICKRTMQKLKVLFLCTGNSCRSQMAEGWARHLKGDVIEPYSAGIETHGLDPRAVKVMAEAGVDISGHRSKHVDEVKDVRLRLRRDRLRPRPRIVPVVSGQDQGRPRRL